MDAFEKNVAQGSAGQIQNQVVHIAGPHQQEHLQDLYGGDNGQHKQQRPVEFPQGAAQRRWKEAHGHKQQNVPQKIGQGVGQVDAVDRPGKNPPIVFDDPEGNRIHMAAQPHRIGQGCHIRPAEKQQENHGHAIEKGKDGKGSFLFWMQGFRLFYTGTVWAFCADNILYQSVFVCARKNTCFRRRVYRISYAAGF